MSTASREHGFAENHEEDRAWVMMTTLQPVIKQRLLESSRQRLLARIEQRRNSRVILLAHHKGKVTVIVPHYAMSGGTLIALAADEIILSPHAVLGPVDPQPARRQPTVEYLPVPRHREAHPESQRKN